MTSNGGKIRVLLIIAGLPAGGAERQMATLARTLDRTVYEVGLTVFNTAEKVHFCEIFDRPLWFRALNLSPKTDGILLAPRLITELHRAVLDFKPDILHTSLNVANHVSRIASLIMRWGVPIVTSVRADFREGYRLHERLLERLLWRHSDRIICNSEIVRQQLITDLYIPSNRVVTVANGIDDQFFEPTTIKQPPDWPNGRVALVVGRFQREKNHLQLVEAIATIKQRDQLNDWHFVFIGEGPLKDKIKQSIQEHDIGNKILLFEPQTALIQYYKSAKLLILPSRFEGLSNSLLEAAACGCPAAVSQGANKAGIIEKGRGWILTDPLENSLVQILKSEEIEFKTTGKHAAAYVYQNFSLTKMIDGTTRVYRSVLKSAFANINEATIE